MAFQAKLSSHNVFQSHTVWCETFQNVKAAQQNRATKNI